MLAPVISVCLFWFYPVFQFLYGNFIPFYFIERHENTVKISFSFSRRIFHMYNFFNILKLVIDSLLCLSPKLFFSTFFILELYIEKNITDRWFLKAYLESYSSPKLCKGCDWMLKHEWYFIYENILWKYLR